MHLHVINKDDIKNKNNIHPPNDGVIELPPRVVIM